MRLDRRLAISGLADSRARARALIEAGVVTVDGRVADKAALPVGDDALIEITADPCPWVSRAALKLLHGLDHFGLSPNGARALDVGASTGGFTEVLLARGAASVVAVDVGRGQLHPRIADDPRVVSLEATDARTLSLDHAPDFITCDASFIALSKVLAHPLSLAAPGATLVALIKPQFELGPGAVGKGGVVRSAAARERACAAVERWIVSKGWSVLGLAESPVHGGAGNIETLIAARRP